MSMDFRHALDEIAAQAQGAVGAVDVDGLRARVRRRRTQGVVVRSVGGLAAVGVLAASVALLGGGEPRTGSGRGARRDRDTDAERDPDPDP